MAKHLGHKTDDGIGSTDNTVTPDQIDPASRNLVPARAGRRYGELLVDQLEANGLQSEDCERRWPTSTRVQRSGI
jgi:hypothetical protein